MGFAILLNELIDFPMDMAAPIIAQGEDIIYADATRALRDPTGFLVKNLPYNEANSICAQLNNIGIGCFVMDMSQFYHPPDYQNINTASINEDAFFISNYYGTMVPLHWSDLIYIAVGKILPHKKEKYTLGSQYDDGFDFSMTQIDTMRGTGYVPNEPLHKKPAGKTKTRHVVDLFFKQPNESHYRIFSNGFNYSYLGHRIGISSGQNFRMLVEDIVHFAPHAFGNKGIGDFLNNGPPKDMSFKDMRIFDEQNLWMLQIVYLNLNQ